MELKQQFEKVMAESENMALATCVENKPNVRIVTFAYDSSKSGRLFFTTFTTLTSNQKIEEFKQNPNVSCTSLPAGPESDIQVRIFGTVKKSDVTLEEFIGIIEKKLPRGADFFKNYADQLEIYEVCFDKAHITVGMTDAQIVSV